MCDGAVLQTEYQIGGLVKKLTRLKSSKYSIVSNSLFLYYEIVLFNPRPNLRALFVTIQHLKHLESRLFIRVTLS